MEDLRIYWAGIEYKYGQSFSKNDKLKGGFVYGFVKAKDVRDALNKFDRRLKEEDLIPIEIEFITTYDNEMEWETEEQKVNYCRLISEAQETSEVVFDDFYAYENEDTPVQNVKK